ncbi:hypothetical protein D3C87_2103440 [compost metagenome]
MKSIISDILLVNAVFEAIFTTGATGFPIGFPNPVVNKTTVAPAPTNPVVHSASFPGVFRRLNPGFEIYSP